MEKSLEVRVLSRPQGAFKVFTMKRLFFTILLLSTVIITVQFLPSHVGASNEGATPSATSSSALITSSDVTKNTIHEGNYYAFNEKVVVSGIVRGDVIAAGGEVQIDGTVTGDLIAAGGDITVSGIVEQNVRVAGGNVLISGRVGRNVLVTSGSLKLLKDSSIAGTLTAAAGEVNIDGTVNGNVDTMTNTLKLGPNLKVNGNVLYIGNDPAEKSGSTQIKGELLQRAVPTNREQKPEPFLFIFYPTSFIWILFEFLSQYLIGLLFVLIAPRQTIAVANIIIERPLRSLLFGVMVLIGVPLLAIILLATIVGIPTGIILFFLYFLAMYLSGIFFVLLLGIKSLRISGMKADNLKLSLAVGLFIFVIVKQILFIGPLFGFIAMLLVLGAMAMFLKEALHRLAGRI